MFITVYTKATTCFYPKPDKSSPFTAITLTLTSHLGRGLPSDFFLQFSPRKSCLHVSAPHTCYITGPSSISSPSAIWWKAQNTRLLLMQNLRQITGSPQLWLFNFAWKKQYLLTTLFTPWSIIIPEKLTGSQLVKKFPAFYGTRRFITAFTTARHLSRSRARSFQPMHLITPPEDPS
jgi:hypothetical protein